MNLFQDNWLLLQFIGLCVAGVLVLLGFAISMRRIVRNRQIRRWAALEAEVRPLLMRAMSDDEPDVSGLSVFDAKRIEPIVWQLVTKVRGASRRALVEWLEAQGAVDRARRNTRRLGSVRRALAAEHLGAAGLSVAVPDLTRLLDDRAAEVRIVAARALGKLGDESVVVPLLERLVAKRSIPAGIVSMALVHTGPPAVPGLTKGLASPHPSIRAVSIELLGLYGAIETGKWMALALAHDSSVEVRERAATALGRLGLPQAEEPLRRATAASGESALRVAATVALGRLGSRKSIGALQQLICDDDPLVAAAASQALVEYGDTGAEVLRVIADTEGPGTIHARHWLVRQELRRGARRQRRVGTREVAS